MKTELTSAIFISAGNPEPDEKFDQEKYVRHIERTSLIGQMVILLITLFAAMGLFAQPQQKKQDPAEPVSSIVDFHKTMENGAAKFVWIAEEDSLPCIFQLQKSKYGSIFKTIANISMRATEKKMRFAFIDDRLTKGLYYYRIKKINPDERIEVSSILQVYSASDNEDDELGEIYSSATITPVE